MSTQDTTQPFILTRIDGPNNPPPKGFCEVWRGKFDNPRRVEILAWEAKEDCPGVIHVVGYQENTHLVTGTFYVPVGQTLVGHNKLI